MAGGLGFSGGKLGRSLGELLDAGGLGLGLGVTPRKKQGKYNNVPTYSDGHKFDSRHECHRYKILCVMQQAGAIRGLKLQVPYAMHVNGVKVCTYIADFVYLDTATGDIVVEDAKGVRTAAYVIKAKLMKAVYGITIKET